MTDKTDLPATETGAENLPAEKIQQLIMMEDLNMRQAEVMATSTTIPVHLQGNPGNCLGIIQQARKWGMDAYSVAQKTFIIKGVMGYEAQLVNAVVQTCGVIDGSFHYTDLGDWDALAGKFTIKKNQQGKEYRQPNWSLKDEDGLGVIVSATLAGEVEPRDLKIMLHQAQTRNSTLWASNPLQQLKYLGVKMWARLYAPAALLGVYDRDELESIKDINPKPSRRRRSGAANAFGKPTGTTIDAEPVEVLDPVVEDWKAVLNSCDTETELANIGAQIKKAALTEEQKKALGEVYKTAKAALTE